MDATTLIFLLLAGFVIWRLRSVLGQRTGNERPPRIDPALRQGDGSPPAPRGGDNVVVMPGARAGETAVRSGGLATAPRDRWAGLAEPGTPLAGGLDAVASADASFDAMEFLAGARGAYEMTVTAFASGDRKSLQALLSRDVYEGFENAIGERETKGERVETTFVSIDKAEMLDAQLRARIAHLTVRFVSKLISATRDRSGEVIDGSPDKVVEVTDVWTFARDTRARDPNWQLVATEAGS